MILALVFDLDGTLVDTAPDLMAVADDMLKELGAAPLEQGRARLAAGRGARELLTQGLEAAGRPLPPEERWPELVEEFIARYEARLSVLSRPFAGVPELLAWCRDAGVVMSVCTNKRESLARKLLRDLELDGCFERIIGGDTLPLRKPHPRPVLAALPEAHDAAFMLGDSEQDMRAARAAGVAAVLAGWGYLPPRHDGLGADHVIPHPADITTLLASVRSSR